MKRPEPESNPQLAPLPRISGIREFSESFEVSRETLDRLQRYADTLALWQKRINLVAPATIPDTWHRHIADSAQLLPLAPAEARHWVDLGCGAGFPGLVIAILWAEAPPPGAQVTLVESDQRKCAFMAEVVRQTGLKDRLPVDIVCARIETPTTRATIESADVVSARALAPLERLLELASPLKGASSIGLFLKGRTAPAEIDEAKRVWQFSYDVVPSRTDPDARIIKVRAPVVRMEG